MADPRDAALDADGIPDLQGPLEAKATTGDPQEGVPAPSNKPHSFMHGVTDNEHRQGESIATRVEHEQPDFGDAEAGSADDEPVVLIDDAEDGIADLEKDLVRRGVVRRTVAVCRGSSGPCSRRSTWRGRRSS